jgi:hypothetical protein
MTDPLRVLVVCTGNAAVRLDVVREARNAIATRMAGLAADLRAELAAAR